ncbi:hypothetical protein [Geomonas agri]|uniref:hypothetical protein n=1 Tax=Geomonas agri TaxID=2873702 RepID=UPI001CD440D6|nr:hypothetical protein [Geomonas agri]
MKNLSGMNIIFTVVFIAGFFSYSYAEEKYGVKVYPNSKQDKIFCKSFKEKSIFPPSAACYTTNDNPDKVVEFYKRELKNQIIENINKTGGSLIQGNVNVSVQGPWDDTNGSVHNNTYITIIKLYTSAVK